MFVLRRGWRTVSVPYKIPLRNSSSKVLCRAENYVRQHRAYTGPNPRWMHSYATRESYKGAWIFAGCLVLAGGITVGYYRAKLDNAKKLLMSPPLKERIVAAQNAIKGGDYTEGYKLYHAALSISSCPQSKPADRNKQAFIMDQIANLAYSMGKYHEAEDMFKKTMKSMIASGTATDDNAVIEISLKLASIYDIDGRDILAETGYKWCITTAEQNCKDPVYSSDSNALLGMAQESLGMYYYRHGDINKAKEYLQNALITANRTMGSTSRQSSIIQNHLCLLHFEIDEYDIAETYIGSAIEGATMCEDEELLAVCLINDGFVKLKKGDVSESTNCLSRIKKLNISADNDEIHKRTEELHDAIFGATLDKTIDN